MSWSGFKKNVGRATTQVMMKTGQVEKTSDRQYEVEERRYRTLESASLRLQKEAKGYLDSLRAMTASQMRIAETIDAFYGDSGATDGVSRSYKQAVEDLDAETVKALDGPYRCVPSDLRKYAWDWEKGVEDKKELRAVEWEMNRGAREGFAGVLKLDMDAYGELMDFIYRTTVLEPINRFCAYFPDINECIKKRNHKMLDYDSMRSKVKRLTEKPDKDPAKLPRTEKEQDMVSLSHFLYPDELSSTGSFLTICESNASMLTFDDDTDLGVPSPPKALNGIRQRLGLGLEEDELDTGTGSGSGSEDDMLPLTPSRGRRTARTLLARTSSIISSYSTLLSPRRDSEFDEDEDQDIPTIQSSPARPKPNSWSLISSPLPTQSSPLRLSLESRSFTSSPISTTQADDLRRVSSIYSAKSTTSIDSAQSTTSIHSAQSNSTLVPNRSIGDSASTRGGTWPRQKSIFSNQSRPSFEPSELEEIMAPLKDEFMRKQADKLEQAKAAYEQLNEQLMSELPQLIDLRVPYLDPTFEALVKIQLRFCAEAYSRMAQVQQYLDASTRDQYASGDLDARVEDVLGQIRELSIAGTV
ncbi:hypothetical protein Q7P35_008056 [Cladosporium inversicolor]